MRFKKSKREKRFNNDKDNRPALPEPSVSKTEWKETREAFYKEFDDEIDRRIFDLRSQGYSYEEIAWSIEATQLLKEKDIDIVGLVRRRLGKIRAWKSNLENERKK